MYLQGLLRQAIGLQVLVVLVVLVILVVLMLSACGGSAKGAKTRPLPEERQALRPGTYRSEEFKPSLTFKVGKGWKNVLPETSDGMANVDDVYKPNETGSPKLVKAPDDLVGWFEHHPYLETSKLQPVTVGGVKGKQFDAQVGDLPELYFGVCGAQCVDITRFNDGSVLAAYKGIKAHVFVLEDVKGKTMLMGISSKASDFDEFAPKAQKVVDSVKWTSS